MSRTPKRVRRDLATLNHPNWLPPSCYGPTGDPVLRDVDRWYCRRMPDGPCGYHRRITHMHTTYARRSRHG